VRERAARIGRRRRWSLAAIVAACIAAGAILLATSGSGAPDTVASAANGTAVGRITTAPPAVFRAAMVRRLRARRLNYQWVACVPSGRRFHGVRIVRCNVDFGIDPHVEAYCSVMRGGRLLTSADDRSIPCGADRAGRMPKLITYG
jgi:hypothetical protein